jgi:hypothetical protein
MITMHRRQRRATSGCATRLECWSASGSVRSQLQPAEAPADSDRRLFVIVRTTSGDITITRAA